ncbi:hypothetical protein [Pseudidiomarina insulisalsae]|uniref:Plastocyanin-like domain-containing protein n=1 Tax=Pseudidiomarina insulisalsae TaxID=575789 RepID=A0A432YQQ7_9GAMM|nr:hypothetical protein [Pseudidiomarina insulisalsae]RUO63680.1 hypothetical protein CWI71_01045 [Pseudidiomarina insulisalsae]
MKTLQYVLFLLTLLAVTALSLLSTAHAASVDNGDPYIVEVNARDYHFDMPKQIKSGWVTFRFHNKGEEMHVAIIGKRPDGVDPEDFKDAIEKLQVTPSIPQGGPGLHSPGHGSDTAIYMPPGDYVMLCGTRTAAGHQHYRLGMMHYFKVTEEPSNAPEPEENVNMTLSMYDVSTDAPLKPGHNTIRIKNNTGNFADVHLVSLNGPVTMADARQYLETLKEPGPGNFMGGIEQGDPENIHYLSVDLKEGDYGLISHEAAGFGINKTFKVSDTASAIPRDDIDHEMVLTFSEDGMTGPDRVPAGRVRIVNNTLDDRAHAAVIVRLREGKTPRDALNFILGLSKNIQDGKLDPFDGLSKPLDDFFLQLPIHLPENNISVELEPGRYGLICPAGASTDEAHSKQGGLHEFTVY